MGGSAWHVLVSLELAILLIMEVAGADGRAVHLLLVLSLVVLDEWVLGGCVALFNSIHN